MAKKSVFITIPNTGLIHKKVMWKILELQKNKKYNIILYTPSFKPYENNLHHIVEHFISKKYDFWLNIDSDNPPTKNPLDLIRLDKDIIGLPTPVWHYDKDDRKNKKNPVYLNAYKYVPKKKSYCEYFPQNGLQEVDAVGTGCFLVAKRVFGNKEMRKVPFGRKLDGNGVVVKGNDISFCAKAKKNGFKVWCHFGYPCSHYKIINLLDVLNAFQTIN